VTDLDEIAPEEWDRTLEVNITSQFNCARLAIEYLSDSSNPSIINLSSAAGRVGFPLRSPYSASKWAAVGFTKTLAIEPGRVRVNAILPGEQHEEFLRQVGEGSAVHKEALEWFQTLPVWLDRVRDDRSPRWGQWKQLSAIANLWKKAATRAAFILDST